MQPETGNAFQNGREDSEQKPERGECELQIAKQALHPYVFLFLAFGCHWLRRREKLMGRYTAVDLSFIGLGNTVPEDAEVFCPIAAPRWVGARDLIRTWVLTGWFVPLQWTDYCDGIKVMID